MSVALAVLAVSAALALYTYVGYPAILWVWSLLRPAPLRRAEPSQWPMVSIVLPAFNEEATIAATLEALLAVDYPPDCRQILVVSDASTDRTDEIVGSYTDRGVELLRQPVRAGKTAAENASLRHLRGEIVVNTDASIRIRPDALKPLVACFIDPAVGVASGRDLSVARTGDTGNVGESGYVGYEMWVRALETRVDGIVGASGCFYAIRKDLHMNLVPEALSRDFAAALTARTQGYRAVSVDDAICFVPRASSLRLEYRRKLRTITRGIETLYFRRSLLNPLKHGRFAWMLFSHKVCRWALPWMTLAAGVAVTALAFENRWARWVLAAVAAWIALAVAGWYWPNRRRMPVPVSLAALIFWGTVAVLRAAMHAVGGELNPIWEPTRRAAVDVP